MDIPIRRIETPAARHSDPLSSHLSADEVTTSGRRQNHIERVIRAVYDHPGFTSAELTPHTGLDRVEVARRMSDAETTGKIGRGQLRACGVSRRLAVTWWPLIAERAA